jgi:N-methylhydantoinase B
MTQLDGAALDHTGLDLTAEILRRALVTATEEASIVVVRSAYSTFIVEGSDASAAILDTHGRLVAQSMATSLAHAASLRLTVQAILEDKPLETMRPGDVFVTNDPYRGGIHANDLCVFQPVFVDGAPRWFTATLIHVSDLGGVAAGGVHATATDVFQEGLQLPPVLLADVDGLIPDIARTLALNSRTPEKVIGDVEALMAGTTVAARRLEALIEEYGADGLARGIEDYLEYGARLVRQGIRDLPDGTYHGSYTIDGDGFDLERAYDVKAAVTVTGDRLIVDFEGSSPQVPRPINSCFSQTVSGVIFAVRCFLDPSIPMNEGCFEPLEVRAPVGSLLNPTPPMPTGGRFIPMYAVIDAIVEALSQAVPEHAVAPSGILTPIVLSSAGTDGTPPWINMSFDFGGVGARRGKDGPDATGLHFGLGRNMVAQAEPIELRCRFVVEGLEVIPDSGGPGRWRGGAGSRTTIRVLEDAYATFRADRHRFPPPGKDGGGAGRAGGYYLVKPDGTRTQLPNKVSNLSLAAGDTIVMETSGGGGLGEPYARPVDDVLADIADRRLTENGAHAYGVVLDADGAVDEPSTQRLRGHSE